MLYMKLYLFTYLYMLDKFFSSIFSWSILRPGKSPKDHLVMLVKSEEEMPTF